MNSISASSGLNVVLLRKNESLVRKEHQGFIAFLLVDWVCYRFVAVGDVVHGQHKTIGKRLEDFRLNSVRVCARKCDRENDGGCARSNLLIDVSSACLLY